jgi:hypothetical protein
VSLAPPSGAAQCNSMRGVRGWKRPLPASKSRCRRVPEQLCPTTSRRMGPS